MKESKLKISKNLVPAEEEKISNPPETSMFKEEKIKERPHFPSPEELMLKEESNKFGFNFASSEEQTTEKVFLSGGKMFVTENQLKQMKEDPQYNITKIKKFEACGLYEVEFTYQKKVGHHR